jgi:hypothetical protein
MAILRPCIAAEVMEEKIDREPEDDVAGGGA